MSHYPPHGYGPPPPYYGPPPPWGPHHHHPPPPSQMYPLPPDGGAVTTQPHPYPNYVTTDPMLIPVPVAPMPVENPGQPTCISNHVYHGESAKSNSEHGQPVECSGNYSWLPTTATTASHLTGKAVVGGHEGWDGSLLWVVRSWHNGDLIPGKFTVRHNAASIAYDKKEIPVQNIEVLCARPEQLIWIPASNGNVPPAAIPGGRTVSGETLYIGRARHQLSITPGKVHPSHGSCYISFAGTEVAYRTYDILCRIRLCDKDFKIGEG